LFRIGGVLAAEHHIQSIVINLPEDVVSFMLNRSKVVFSVWIVVASEAIERLYFLPGSRFTDGDITDRIVEEVAAKLKS
jgi:hypothetical protein